VQFHKVQNFVHVMFRPIIKQIIMSNVNTQNSLLQVRQFSRQYSSQIGCMSSVKKRVASVGVSHVCRPFTVHLSC